MLPTRRCNFGSKSRVRFSRRRIGVIWIEFEPPGGLTVGGPLATVHSHNHKSVLLTLNERNKSLDRQAERERVGGSEEGEREQIRERDAEKKGGGERRGGREGERETRSGKMGVGGRWRGGKKGVGEWEGVGRREEGRVGDHTLFKSIDFCIRRLPRQVFADELPVI